MTYSGMPGSLRLDETPAVGVGRGLRAVGATGLAQDAADMVGGGVLADGQRAPDLAVAEAAGDETEDLDLARGQPVGERRGRRGGPQCPDAPEQRRQAA